MKKNNDKPWQDADQQQRQKLLEEITKENCSEKLKLVRNISGMSRRELAKILGVSEPTIRRIETNTTEPTDDFMNRVRALCLLGIETFKSYSEKDKEKVSEFIGSAGGSVAGIGGALGAVSALGTISGLSAAGMTSGLAAIGGGAMVTGIAVVASIPVAAGLGGYGLVKGIKKICEANNLTCEKVNDRWEIKTTEAENDKEKSNE